MKCFSTLRALGPAIAAIALSANTAASQNTASSSPAAVLTEAPAPASGNALDLSLRADLSKKTLFVLGADSTIEQYPIADGTDNYPTPRGTFLIRKIVWNPKWVPPDSKWARNKTPKDPGAKDNPMKVVKIFFKEPDYYIHGTGETGTLGNPASHGCLRMDPNQVAALARLIMEHGGQPREESWLWRV